MYQYNATVVNIVDGDTVDLNMDLGFHIWVTKRIRLAYIDTPERFSDEGKKATEFVKQTIPVGSNVVVKTSLDSTDKYGRVLGEIYRPDELKSLNKILLENNLAKEYK